MHTEGILCTGKAGLYQYWSIFCNDIQPIRKSNDTDFVKQGSSQMKVQKWNPNEAQIETCIVWIIKENQGFYMHEQKYKTCFISLQLKKRFPDLIMD